MEKMKKMKKEESELKIRKGWLRFTKRLLGLKTCKKAIQVKRINAWRKEEALLNSEYPWKIWVIENDWSSEEEIGKSLSLRSKCSLDIHLVTPFTIFVPFPLIQINTNPYIFLIRLSIYIMYDPNDYCFS